MRPEETTDAGEACAHCGLPVGAYPVEAASGVRFCCTGCSVVYATLRAEGYGDTYYRLQKLAPGARPAQPAQTPTDALQLGELDTEAFLSEHARPAPGDERAIELFLDGVHCAACVWLVEQLPFAVEGVREARLDLARARLTLRWDPARARLSDAARWLARFGYTTHPLSAETGALRTAAERRLLIKLGICWALAGNIMLLAFAFYSGLDLADDRSLASSGRWMSLALATPSLLFGGSEFFRAAWASVRYAWRTRDPRNLHMDLPISLGILAGFTQSAWATAAGSGEVWFDSIAVLIAALLTARWLQMRSRRLAGDATERLLSLLPTMVRRIDAGGAVAVVRAEDVQPGDLVEVPAGEVVPVDGIVETGASALNNAVLTGESRPEPAAPGALVQAGASNMTAPLRIRVRAAGAQTRVGRLLAWVRDQEHRGAPVVLLANRISGYFVLGVLLLSAATLAGWYVATGEPGVSHVVALLVITCPCALGMATPLAMTVAAGQAARAGIFIKSDEALQQLAAADCIVLDKTGTLTRGDMTLAAADGDPAALEAAALLEQHSNHPIGRALRKALRPPAAPPEAVLEEAVAGQGLRGRVGGRRVVVGRPAWVAEHADGADIDYQARLEAYTAAGYTPVGVALDGRLAAMAAVGDAVRRSSAPLVAALKASGKAVYMASGDHRRVAATVAEQLGILPEHVLGEAAPEDKQRFIRERRREHRSVVMVGDGVNDAAALQTAHVGIAVHGGSSASMVAADVFLTRPGLEPVIELLEGARNVMRTVRRNLAISLLYNLAGAAAAMLGLVDPLVAAIAMPLSSLVVVASSILQRSFRPRLWAGRDEDAAPLLNPSPASGLKQPATAAAA